MRRRSLLRFRFSKRFLCLTGKESLFQEAIKRLLDLASEDVNVCSPFIVINEEYQFLALEKLREFGTEAVCRAGGLNGYGVYSGCGT